MQIKCFSNTISFSSKSKIISKFNRIKRHQLPSKVREAHKLISLHGIMQNIKLYFIVYIYIVFALYQTYDTKCIY